MTSVVAKCAGCDTSLPPQDGPGRPRKWCSDRCRKQTLYGGECVDCGALTNGSDGRKPEPRCASCNGRLAAAASAEKQRARSSREAIVQVLRDWEDEHGRMPTVVECGLRGHAVVPFPAHHHVICRVFGSWAAGIRAAGGVPRRRGYHRVAA